MLRASSVIRIPEHSISLKRLPYALIFVSLVSVTVLLTACQNYQFKGTPYPDPKPAPDFELTTSDGHRFRLSEHQGQIALVFFGYTSCPDICPTTLAEASRTLDALENDTDVVTFLFITVDPDRDTPEVLANYVAAFHPAILGLTGATEELTAVYRAYGITADKEPLGGSAPRHLVNHTARLFLVDAEGRLRLSYAFGSPPDAIIQDIRHLLG